MSHELNAAQPHEGKLSLFARMKNRKKKNLPDAGALFFAMLLSSAMIPVLLVNCLVFIDYLRSTATPYIGAIIAVLIYLMLFFLARRMNGVILTFPNKTLKWSLFLVLNFVFPLSVFLLTFRFLEYLQF